MSANIFQRQALAIKAPLAGEDLVSITAYQERLDCLENPNRALCITGIPGVGKSTLARGLVGQDIPIYDDNIATLTGVERVRVDDDAIHAFDTDIQNLREIFTAFYQGSWLCQEGIMVTGLERIAISQLGLLSGAEFQTEMFQAFARKHNLLQWQSDAVESVLFWQKWFADGLLDNYEYMNLLTAEQHSKWKRRLLTYLIEPMQSHDLHPIPLNIVITAPPGRLNSEIAGSFPERFERARFVEVLPAMSAFYIYLTEMFPNHYYRVEAFDKDGERKSEGILRDEVLSILRAKPWAGIDSLSP